MSTSPRMGRGLDALWGNADAGEVKKNTSSMALHNLIPNPNQPRRQFDEQSLTELADSIKQQGIIQPILVRPIAQSKNFEIIAGERRWRAAQKAGLKEVPVFIKDMSDEEVMAAALIENIQRENLTPMEEALALQSLREECGITQEELATRLGKSRSALANTLRLLQLPKSMQEALNQGSMQAGHARTLLSLQQDSDAQEKLFAAILEQKLSVRDAEAAVNYVKEHACFPWEKAHSHEDSQNEQEVEISKPATKSKSSRTKSIYLKNLQDKVKEKMLVKTAISGDEQRGRITLTYTNAEELMFILEHMGVDGSPENDDTFPVKQ